MKPLLRQLIHARRVLRTLGVFAWVVLGPMLLPGQQPEEKLPVLDWTGPPPPPKGTFGFPGDSAGWALWFAGSGRAKTKSTSSKAARRKWNQRTGFHSRCFRSRQLPGPARRSVLRKRGVGEVIEREHHVFVGCAADDHLIGGGKGAAGLLPQSLQCSGRSEELHGGLGSGRGET